MSLRPASTRPLPGADLAIQCPAAAAPRPPALARLGVLLLLLALLPLHVLAPFLHAHTEADPRAAMQAGLHLPGLEALEDDARDGGPAYGLRHPPLIEEADLGRRQAGSDPDEAPAPAHALGPAAAAGRLAPVAEGAPPPRQAPPAPPARAPPPEVSVDA